MGSPHAHLPFSVHFLTLPNILAAGELPPHYHQSPTQASLLGGGGAQIHEKPYPSSDSLQLGLQGQSLPPTPNPLLDCQQGLASASETRWNF